MQEKGAQNEDANEGTKEHENFRYYTDSTGNNHAVVRSILNRRSWLSRTEKLNGKFDQINFFWTQWYKSSIGDKLQPNQIYGKIDSNFLLCDKSNLLITMCEYALENKEEKMGFMPKTYNLKAEKDMSGCKEFERMKEMEGEPIWICKPGENSNRGNGITLYRSVKKMKAFLETKSG